MNVAGAQQFDAYGKIFTIKLQYVFYKERPGVRPGQVTKAERITNKLSKFAQYAIQGDYEGCKEFGSDLKKLGLPVEHAPQVDAVLYQTLPTYFKNIWLQLTCKRTLIKILFRRKRLHIGRERCFISGLESKCKKTQRFNLTAVIA